MDSLAISPKTFTQLEQKQENNAFNLKFNETKRLSTKEVISLNISHATNLSDHPDYKDSFFKVNSIFEKGDFFFQITRYKLDPPPSDQIESIDSIIQRLTPDDNHFKIEDIKAIGQNHLGLRHLSSHEKAEKERQEGMTMGCSLNISFSKVKQGGCQVPNKFEDLHMRSDEAIAQTLPEYEEGINQFIQNSILQFDLDSQETGGGRLQHFLDVTKKTAYMVLKYSEYDNPCDSDAWGNGLGRFSKMDLPGKNITVLKPLDVTNWAIADESRKQYAYQQTKIIEFLTTHYRKSLLTHIRTLQNPKDL